MDTHEIVVGVHGQPPRVRGYPWTSTTISWVPMDTHQKLVGVHGQPPKFRGYPWPPISLARTSLVGNHEILSKLSRGNSPPTSKVEPTYIIRVEDNGLLTCLELL